MAPASTAPVSFTLPFALRSPHAAAERVHTPRFQVLSTPFALVNGTFTRDSPNHSSGRYHSHFYEAQTQLLSVALALVSPWPFHLCPCTAVLHEEACYWSSPVRMLVLPRWCSG